MIYDRNSALFQSYLIRMNKANTEMQTLPLYSLSHGLPIVFRRICEEHPVFLIENFATPEECAFAIEFGEPLLKQSTAVEGSKIIHANYRTSSTAFLTQNGIKSSEPILANIQQRASTFCWLPISHIEALNLTRYKFGQEYKEHHDYFAGTQLAGKAGDRIATFFVYLNDVPEDAGGCTTFPKLNLTIQPKRGNAVFWLNSSFDGQSYENTLHAGMPILRREVIKYGLNVWCRARSF